MQFKKELRARVKSGEITTSVRIWQSPRVKAGNRYKLDEGFILVESIQPIALADVTPRLARESGFAGVADLLRTTKHGRGENVYFVRFRYEEDG